MKKCKDCNESKPLNEFGEDKRSKDGHASACLSCKGASVEAEPKGEDFQEKLDNVVSSMNDAVGDLNGRVSGIEGSITEILSAVRAINNPVTRRDSYEAGQDGLGESFVATAAEENGESVIIKPRDQATDDPSFIDKMEMEKFMNEVVTVHISETSDKFADPNFAISVNGRTEVFFRNQEKKVKRKFVEGLARARPVHFGNEETKDQNGNMTFHWPSQRGLRYPFSVIEDKNPKGREWLSNLLRQA